MAPDHEHEDLDDERRGDLDTFDERNAAPPILRSPRSLEACRMLGIDPGDLVQRPLEFFAAKNVRADDAGLAEKRALRYEKNRQIQLRNARAQRHELIDAGLTGRLRSVSRSPVGDKLSMSKSASGALQLEITAVERERKELERMQQRQLAEMQQMLAFELKRADEYDERQRKEAEKRRQEEQLVREQTRRQRESDELKRRRELERVEQHKLELELARREAQKAQAEAVQKEQRARKEEERRRRDAQLAEKERARRQEELRAQCELTAAAQLREAETKEREVARRDERRQQQLASSKRLKALEASEKQQRNKLRISSVLQDKEALQTAQQCEAERKQQVGEERRRQFEAERRQKDEDLRFQAQRKRDAIDAVQTQLQVREQQRRDRLVQQGRDADRRLHAKELAAQAEREQLRHAELRQEHERRRAYERMESQLRHRQETYAHQAEAKAHATQRTLDEKRRSARSRLQEAKLREEEIQAALARRHKQEAYRLELLASRIAGDDARAQALKDQRERLVRRRQQLQQSAGRRKHELLDSFYRMKVTNKFALPPQLAATWGVRPQSAGALQTRSLIEGDGFAAARPASALARPRNKAAAASGRDDERRRRHSDTDKRDDERDDERDKRDDERDANNAKLHDAVLRAEVDALRRTHNEELLQVLEQEHHAEEQREHLVHQARDAAESARMERIFGSERALASERIMAITQRHERALAKRIQQLQGTQPSGHRDE